MTDRELDRVMQRVLLDSMRREVEQAGENQEHAFEPTARHTRQMRAMLKDPNRWLRRREHPLWKQVARRAAVILLTCILAFGAVMAFSPTARAAVIRWFMERYGNRIDFVYSGEQNGEELPEYGIAELPDGYVETQRYASPGSALVIYENQSGDAIYLTYDYMSEGAMTSFTLNEDDVFDITVHGMKGLFFQTRISGNFNSLTWIDEAQNIHFSVKGNFDMEQLLALGESTSLCKTPK